MLSPYVVPFLVSAAISLLLAVYVVRHPRTKLTDRTTAIIVVLLVLAAQWSVAYLFRLVSVGEQAKLTWVLIEYAGSGLMSVAWLLLAAEYAGYGSYLTRRRIGLLAVEPILAFLLVASNPVHHLMWSEVQVTDVGSVSVLERAFGPWFYVHIAYSYVLILIGCVLFVRAFVTSDSLYRGQVAALAGAVVAPFAGNVGFVFDLGFFSQIEFTSAGFALANVLLVFGIFRYRLLDLTPISHAVTVNTMQDAYLVVDRNRRVVHANPAACDLFGIDSTALGDSVERTLPTGTDLFVDGEESQSVRHELTIEREGDSRYLDAVVTPIANSRLLGWSVVFRDITSHKRHERELRRQNGRLDEFASVVAHDLRNPLSVAQGRVTLARRESDSEHLESATRSLDRIETIVDDTLTLARQGKSVGEMDSVDLRTVVEGCWRTVSTGDATLDVNADVTVRADPDRLRHVVENLVRNSIGHGSANSRPEAGGSAEHGGSGVVIGVGSLGEEGFYIEDNGPGIPEETRQAIFDPAYTTDRNGVGLGLTIVKRIAEAHGWTVTVTEGSMGGARFEFRGVDVVSDPASEPDSDDDERA